MHGESHTALWVTRLEVAVRGWVMEGEGAWKNKTPNKVCLTPNEPLINLSLWTLSSPLQTPNQMNLGCPKSPRGWEMGVQNRTETHAPLPIV